MLLGLVSQLVVVASLHRIFHVVLQFGVLFPNVGIETKTNTKRIFYVGKLCTVDNYFFKFNIQFNIQNNPNRKF